MCGSAGELGRQRRLRDEGGPCRDAVSTGINGCYATGCVMQQVDSAGIGAVFVNLAGATAREVMSEELHG